MELTVDLRWALVIADQLAATVAQLRPFGCRNDEVAALYAYAFMTHAGEPLAVEASHLVGMLTRVSAAEIGIDMLAAFLRNARTA